MNMFPTKRGGRLLLYHSCLMVLYNHNACLWNASSSMWGAGIPIMMALHGPSNTYFQQKGWLLSLWNMHYFKSRHGSKANREKQFKNQLYQCLNLKIGWQVFYGKGCVNSNSQLLCHTSLHVFLEDVLLLKKQDHSEKSAYIQFHQYILFYKCVINEAHCTRCQTSKAKIIFCLLGACSDTSVRASRIQSSSHLWMSLWLMPFMVFIRCLLNFFF